LALSAIALIAAVLVAISSFLDLIVITTGTTTLDTKTGIGHHSIAMIVLGAGAAMMALGAWRGARPAMLALAVIGVVVLIVAFTVDLPSALDEGIYGQRYEAAHAKPGVGFYVETGAGAALLVSGGLLLLMGAGRPGALEETV
jgi:hypothetical protein